MREFASSLMMDDLPFHSKYPSALEAAVEYARGGLRVFPCGPDKKPFVKWKSESTTDLRIIKEWWDKSPSAMIGLPTGDGLTVIDVDVDKETGETKGQASAEQLGIWRLIQSGLRAQTPSGGLHAYFKGDLPNSAGRLGPCLDTRGSGGYVIAPGSRSNIGSYRWINGSILDAELPDLPEEICAKFQAMPQETSVRDLPLSSLSAGFRSDQAGESEVRELLSYIDPDSGGYEAWCSVLMALHDHFNGSNVGLVIADEWSTQGEKYQPGEIYSKWRSFKLGGGTTLRTICELARQNGADLSEIFTRYRGKNTFNTFSASPTTSKEARDAKSFDNFEKLLAAAKQLSNPPKHDTISNLLERIALTRLDPLPERQVLDCIKSASSISLSVLEKQLAQFRRGRNVSVDPNVSIPRPTWFDRLRLDLHGRPERNEANAIIALSSDPVFAGMLAFDEFEQQLVVLQPLPWDGAAVPLPRPWEDADDVRAAEWLQLRGINVAPVVVSRAVGAVARELRIHPVRDWLDTLTWDGTPRIETWTSTYLGAEPTAFHHTIGALWLISAVARIYRPGLKADHMLILEGPQGARKSTAIKVLAGEEWFTDELPELGSKDAALHMQGVWIVEIAELDAIGRAEVSRIKAFLTRTTDRFRPPYGRYTVEVPRQCVFAGTVNPDTYLRDETGNRRFWPLRCGTIDIAALARDRDQLWAEAVHRFHAGAIWWIDDPALLAEAREEQDRRYQSDAWDDLIEHWLTHEIRTVSDGFPDYGNSRTDSVPRPEPLRDVSVGEILEEAIGLEPARWTRGDQMRVSAYLKANGWERYRRRDEGGREAPREWRYRRAAR